MTVVLFTAFWLAAMLVGSALIVLGLEAVIHETHGDA